MTPIICANELDLCVSMSDFVTWVEDECIPNADLAAALKAMGVTLNITELYDTYFDDTPVGAGDVHIYPSAENKSFLVIDLYRELTDQLDIVTASLKIESELLTLVLPHLRRFFDAAECQVAFRQSSHSQQLRSLIEEGRYPVLIDESGYRQQLIAHI
ncbi:hypothetical protein LOY69_10455 [Pseudomonas sp. B21-059]|uniref:hypothetical protein n=1 Tax=Pseudomonas sp. B21-059 TaxID=2895496 RepID=UPI0022348E7A|nr:hypothetical protein [Pseudomonas sp. B21-059]UZE36883.1 hypothetical protein LOY69_10455 [Pseudomonas sp. B21-059]